MGISSLTSTKPNSKSSRKQLPSQSMAAPNFQGLRPNSTPPPVSPLTPPFSCIPNPLHPTIFKIYPKSENLTFSPPVCPRYKLPRPLPRMTAVVPSLVPLLLSPPIAYCPAHSQVNLLTPKSEQVTALLKALRWLSRSSE